MDKIKEQINKPLVTAVLGFILGLIIGLPILGWGIIPVKWIDASPAQLREDVRKDYLKMAIESFSKTEDTQLANGRWKELGNQAEGALNSIQSAGLVNAQDLDRFKLAVGAPQENIQPSGVESITPENSINKKPSMNLILLLVIFCVLTLVIGGTLVYLLFLRKKSISTSQVGEGEQSSERFEDEPEHIGPEKSAIRSDGQELPIAQYITTYTLGDDLYDESFSIDSPSGEFLGECGVSVSDHMGVGDPKKVTAFEVWLFDKNDIQTVTKVLMSEHAFNSPEISHKLVSKGEPVVVEPGKHILLETATLQLEARVVDMSYGQGALPPNSYFERLILELAIWPKPPE
jgi:hypothetical protein